MLLDIPFSLAGYSIQELANNKHPHVLQAANSPIELSILSLFLSFKRSEFLEGYSISQLAEPVSLFGLSYLK